MRPVGPTGTGQWRRIRTVIVDPGRRTLDLDGDAVVVVTPLDVITHLEALDCSVLKVVLAGAQDELALFLKEQYPTIDVVDGRGC